MKSLARPKKLNLAVLATAISLALPLSTLAQDTTTLDTVQVTANRLPEKVADTLASVTVLERGDIERSQAPDLLDLLARQAGVDFSRTGGAGQASTVFLRGSNSNHTLVLIDGLRVNPATQGGFDFAHLPLAQIERIEIVRGPRAALWGSDAIGGVIHIFTRDPSRAFVDARAGSYGRAALSAGIGQELEASRFGLSAGMDRLTGFSATNAAAGPWSFDPDRDGYRNRHLSLRASTAFGQHKLSFNALATDADVEFDMGETAARNQQFGALLAGEINSAWSHSLSLGHSREALDTPAFGSTSDSQRSSLDWVNTLKPNAGNTLNIGFNWSRETGQLDSVFSGRYEVSRRNSALFASWRGEFGPQTFELSARHDDNSQFGTVGTGNAAWGWRASDALRFRASWGQGFHAPTFHDLHYPFFSNPDLRPEYSLSREAGLDWTPDARQRLSLSAFRSHIRDLIVYVGPPSNLLNISRVAIDGVELEYSYRDGAFAFTGNATWQDPRDQLTGAQLLRRARRKYSLSADYTFGNDLLLGLDLGHYGARPDFGASLSGHTRLDLRAAWPVSPAWTLEGRIENLGDIDYELVSGYNTPGRSGLLSLRYRGP